MSPLDKSESGSQAKTIDHLVAGKAWQGGSTRFADVFNPATGQVTGKLRLASAADVDAVVQTALKAQVAWGATPPAKRAAVMFNFRDLLNATPTSWRS